MLLGEDCHGLGVVARYRLSRPCVVGLVVKPVGKPDAGDPHVRFDELGWETGLYATAPILDSTGYAMLATVLIPAIYLEHKPSLKISDSQIISYRGATTKRRCTLSCQSERGLYN